MPRFNDTQTRAVRELIGLPSLAPSAVPAVSRVAIDDVRSALGLPDPPYRELLSDRLWLGGSTLPRWLLQGNGMGDASQGDFDFFVPDVEAFYDAGRFLLARGFTFRTFRSRKVMCQLCGGPAELIGGLPPDVPFLPPLERFRCPSCGDFGGADAAEMTADRLPHLTAAQLADRGLLALELKAPGGAIVHVSAKQVDPDPVRVCTGFDFSVVHFMLDHRDLHFGRHAWTDLLTSRLRLLNLTNRIDNYYRMRKYQRTYGFRPYLKTRLRVELRRRIP